MKNAIYKICEKLKGYSEEDEYFEVLQAERNPRGLYVITVRAIDTKLELQKQGEIENER